ncbi:hypothetical protein D3C84_895570 [compost metagenome]
MGSSAHGCEAFIREPGTVQVPSGYRHRRRSIPYMGRPAGWTGSVYSYGAARAVEAITQLATALPNSERGALATILSGGASGILSAATEYRGAIMQAARDGYRQLNPQVANSMSADVQTTEAIFPDRTITRRHSVHDI